MKSLIYKCACLCAIGTMATAQSETETQQAQTQTAVPSIQTRNLLNVGYEVKAFALVNGQFILTLQRGTSVYICELNTVGVTRVCIAVQ